MDAVDPTLIDQARVGTLGVPDVEAARVRGRWAGRSLRLDVRAELDPGTPIGATAPVVSAVKDAVFDAVDEARVVQVCVVPRI
jgi:divalent metal cation (Fe/Co/Zn/Cd) transporter